MGSHETSMPEVMPQLHAETVQVTDWAHDGSWGLDTVRLSYPIDPEQCDFQSPLWGGQTGHIPRGAPQGLPTLKQQTTIGGHSVRVEMYSSHGRCHIEFNVADYMRTHPYGLGIAETLSVVAKKIIEYVSLVVWPRFQTADELTGEIAWDEDWLTRVQVKRMDVSRNFVCEDSARIKRALAASAHRSDTSHHVHQHPGGGWGVVHGTKQAGQDKIYDKTAHRPLPESEARLLGGDTVLRFEAELKKDRLEAAGMMTLDQVTSERVIAALEKRWAITGWGDPIPSEGSIVAATAGLKYPTRAKVIGHIVLSEAGATDELSKKVKQRWDATAKRAGLVPGMPTAALGEPDSFLDLRSGRLVKLPGKADQQSGIDEEP